MATRSSLPLRLQQLLSSDGAMGPAAKLDSEPPSRIKAFVEKVIQCPLQDIAIPLSGFRWEYGKGNFNHWRPLFVHFDTYFKTYLSGRNDLLLSDDILGDARPFPKHAVLQILRVMQIILGNCHNKSSFAAIELLNLLDVILDNAEKKSNSSHDPGASASKQPSDSQVSTSVVSVADGEQNARNLKNLSKPELQLLCSLLAREGCRYFWGAFSGAF